LIEDKNAIAATKTACVFWRFARQGRKSDAPYGEIVQISCAIALTGALLTDD
jgi:hypothetical protein